MRGTDASVEYAGRYDVIYAGCGIHPDDVGVFEHAGYVLPGEPETGSDSEENLFERRRREEWARFSCSDEAMSHLEKLCRSPKVVCVGEIVSCEAVKKSKKLLCSQVKIGSKTRQILSGIKQWYSPEEMPGKKVLVITNLKPAKLAGLVSEGMILCAEDDQGRLSLVSPEGEVSCGAQVR